jgi:hypothetical protein
VRQNLLAAGVVNIESISKWFSKLFQNSRLYESSGTSVSQIFDEVELIVEGLLCRKHKVQRDELVDRWSFAVLDEFHRMGRTEGLRSKLTALIHKKLPDTDDQASEEELDDDEEKCGVCVQRYVNPAKAVYGHSCCLACWIPWFKNKLKTSCPFCRREVHWMDLDVNR